VNDTLPEPQQRPPQPADRRPSTIGGAVYLAVTATTAVSIAVIALGPWRTGLTLMGGGLLAGAFARLVIPDEKAGMLKVRRKSLDVLLTTVLGVALVTLAVAVPDAA
jgi:hypothetical protein